MTKWALFFWAIGWATAASAGEWVAQHSVTLPSGRPIAVVLPGHLFVEQGTDDEDNPVLVVRNEDDSVLLRATFGEQNNKRISRPSAQKAYLTRALAPYLEQALERSMRFRSMTTADATGTYCIFTDPYLPRDQPPPEGEWIYVTGGIRAWSTWFVDFRLFSNHLDSPDYEILMAVLRDGFREH